jgi:hypothetical protein
VGQEAAAVPQVAREIAPFAIKHAFGRGSLAHPLRAFSGARNEESRQHPRPRLPISRCRSNCPALAAGGSSAARNSNAAGAAAAGATALLLAARIAGIAGAASRHARGTNRRRGGSRRGARGANRGRAASVALATAERHRRGAAQHHDAGSQHQHLHKLGHLDSPLMQKLCRPGTLPDLLKQNSSRQPDGRQVRYWHQLRYRCHCLLY